jgi:hypothetical protein
MFQSGDWITPRSMGEIWVDYPPMIYWAGNVFARLLDGMSAFSLRLPNALAAIVMALMTGAAGKRWFDAQSGLWAGLALLTFFTFVYEGNSYRPDVIFSLAISAGIISYAEGAGEQPRWWLRVAGFAFLGLAMLSKGPLGLLLPGLVLVLWHGARREWRRIIELAPLSLVAIAVYFPWFAATAEEMQWNNMLYEFYAQNFDRFVHGTRGHEQAFFYYAAKFWIDFSPWSWLAPAAIWWTVRSERWRNPKTQLVLWWFGAFFVFLSVAVTKRQLYLLPAYPAMALLLGPWLASVGRAAEDTPQSSNVDPGSSMTTTASLLPAPGASSSASIRISKTPGPVVLGAIATRAALRVPVWAVVGVEGGGVGATCRARELGGGGGPGCELPDGEGAARALGGGVGKRCGLGGSWRKGRPTRVNSESSSSLRSARLRLSARARSSSPASPAHSAARRSHLMASYPSPFERKTAAVSSAVMTFSVSAGEGSGMLIS